MNDMDTLSGAVAKSCVVLSLLGPNLNDTIKNPSLYADMYKNNLFPLMRQHGVRRILAMGTLSISRPEDSWTFIRPVAVFFLRMFADMAYRNIINIASTFEADAGDLDWTIFRIAHIPGKSDEANWKKDREAGGETFVGWTGQKGWSFLTNRSIMARWLADAADGKADEWIGKMPAISRA